MSEPPTWWLGAGAAGGPGRRRKRVRRVELVGGPLDGRRVLVEPGADWLAFGNTPRAGMTATYRASDGRTHDGLEVFVSSEEDSTTTRGR